MLGRALRRGGRVVGRAGDRPEPHPVGREAVVLEVRRIRGVALVRPDETHRAPVDRERDRSAGQPDRTQRRGPPLVRALIEAGVGQPALRQHPLQAGHVCALRQPEAVGLAEAALMRANPGVDLKPPPGERGELGEHGVRGGRGHQRDPSPAVCLLEGAQRLAAEAAEAPHRAGVVVGLGLGGRPQGGAGVRHVAVRGVDAMAAEEGEHPLPHPVRLELIGEHRRDGHRQPLGDVQHRQVRAGEGVEQPLLAERIGAEPLDVGHVGVEDDRQIAAGALGHRHLMKRVLLLGSASEHPRIRATKSSARSRSAARRRKSVARIAGMKRS